VILQALLIKYNMADVDAAIDALNAALARGRQQCNTVSSDCCMLRCVCVLTPTGQPARSCPTE
jgi:hypothetical protein